MIWRPIETAPKDGSDVLLHRVWGLTTSLPPIVAGWFDNGADWCGWASFEQPDKWIEGTPTHWAPLPEPPALSLVDKLDLLAERLNEQ